MDRQVLGYPVGALGGSMLKLTNITKTYSGDTGKVAALKGVSLSVNEGEFIAIMGKSGCGKSTFLNILGCIDRFDSGEYFIQNGSVTSFSDRQRAKARRNTFGFVFQSFYLMPDMDVLSNVAMPLKYTGVPKKAYRERVMPLLERLGIAHLEKRRPSQLSGGEQQRAAIARSLVNDPKIILADEPTGNLDSQNSETVMELLMRLRSDLNKTMILVTHDVKVAAYADRIVEFRDGGIVSDLGGGVI